MAAKKTDEKRHIRRFVTPRQLKQGVALVPSCKITLILRKRKFVFSG